ncbi:hypothetical protein HF673_02705 [Acidithiobacillus thiooxidans]|uniref:hypothetical protein n=1 Tax=Acidithiobacillus thiooxidans TaxID=930 RepID=UPI001C069E30|nr:hypothetical protein [Acidithiobacillus thiooxidans]MBU2834718.1 hypothetical protein [Acidithiobacillus thiooxidans]
MSKNLNVRSLNSGVDAALFWVGDRSNWFGEIGYNRLYRACRSRGFDPDDALLACMDIIEDKMANCDDVRQVAALNFAISVILDKMMERVRDDIDIALDVVG